MSVKEILDDFKKQEEKEKARWREMQEKAAQEVDSRILRIGRCFEEVILPAVRHVERDLKGFGLWHKIRVGQATTAQTGTEGVPEVEFYFYPEKYQTAYHSQRVFDASYKAFLKPTGDFRKISFTIHYPRKLPKAMEVSEEVLTLNQVDKDFVDGFLERFIKGAVDAYQSDRVLF